MLCRYFFLIPLLCTLAVAAPIFIPPDDTRPLIRRELLPLDVSAMLKVGQQLTTLAAQPGNENGAILQRRARALALSQRLHPTFPKTRRLLEAYREGSFQGLKKKGGIESAWKGLAKTASWLLETPPNSEGYKLGQLILDILPSDQPLSGKRDADTEEERWAGVIAPLAAFENDETKPAEKPEPPAEEKRQYLAKTLITKFPFIGLNPLTKQSEARLQDISLVIHDEGEGLKFATPVRNFPTKPLLKSLQAFFVTQDTPLPEGHQLFLDTSGVRYDKLNGVNIASPLAMMLDAALTGEPLQPDTILLAKLRADGSLESPVESWALLQILLKSTASKGTRLIVSPDIEPQLRGLLTLEEAAFFFQYEVLSASTFQEARTLFYQNRELKTPLPEALATFAEVREKAPQNNLGSYLSFKSVRTRLQRATTAKNHLSAKLLDIQAMGKRPAVFTREILARELHHRLQPIASYTAKGRSKRSSKAEYQKLRDYMNALEKRADIRDRDLIETALTTIKPIVAISRELDKEYKEFETRDAIKKLRASTIALRNSFEKIFSASRN